MIDHIYLPVKDIDRSLQFYTALLTPLDFAGRWDFNGQDGWPDLYGFGGDRPRFWLKRSTTTFPELYVAFIATTKEAVEKAYAAALANGGADNGAPGPRPQFSDRYYAANVLDPDGYSLEICFNLNESGSPRLVTVCTGARFLSSCPFRSWGPIGTRARCA